MANQYTETEEKEMDLQDLFDIIKSGFYSIVAVIFKAIDFFLKFWWILLLLAIAGYAIGYFTKGDDSFTTTVIVKTNYDSQPYVYNAVEQFDNYLDEENNTKFLERVGLNVNDPQISEVAISPIIDVVALLSNVPNDRAMTAVIKEIELEEDESIFASEEFYSNFAYHKLEVTVTSPDAEETITKMIDYINNQPQIKKIAEVSKANYKERIAINEVSLGQIDDVIKIYTETVDFANKTAQQTGFYNNENSLSIRELFTTKKELTEENAELKDELTTMEGAVYVVSDTQFKEKGSFMSSKSFMYMTLLILGFLLFSFLRYSYVTLKSKLKERNLD